MRELRCGAFASLSQIVEPEEVPAAASMSTPMGTVRPDTTCWPVHDPANGNCALAGIRGRALPPALGALGAASPAERGICAAAELGDATSAIAITATGMKVRCTRRPG